MATTDTAPSLTPDQLDQLKKNGRLNSDDQAAFTKQLGASISPTIPNRQTIPSMPAAPQTIPGAGAPPPTLPMGTIPTAAIHQPTQATVAPLPEQGPTGAPALLGKTKLQGPEAKELGQEGRPQVTAAPGTEAYGQQKQAQLDYDKAHPWGSAENHPGAGGKIAHVLSRIGNIAGDVIDPGAMALIPGTDLNKAEQAKGNANWIREGAANEEKAAQTEAIKAGGELIPWKDPNTGEQQMVTKSQWKDLTAAETKAGATTEAADTRAAAAKEAAAGKTQTQLLKMGYDKNGEPLPDDKLSPQQKQARDLMSAHEDLLAAQAEVEKSKNDPNSPQFKLAQQRLAAASQAFNLRAQSAQLHQDEFADKLKQEQFIKPSGQTQSRGEAAAAALELLPGLEDAVRANAKSMGPIIGRIAKGEISVGNVAPEVQKFYSQLQSFYAMQPSIHGFRNAEFVKDFDTFIGNLQTNPEALIAGLEGLKPTLVAVNKSGRTYQKRINEGDTEKPPASPAGGSPSYAEWLASQKK